MKKPYLKKHSNVNGFSVWIVDGSHIRRYIDVEFTNFGQHYRFAFIPKDEFWLDNEDMEGEERYFIKHLLVEHRLMASGVSYEEALEHAASEEQKSRNASQRILTLRKRDISQEELLKQTKRQLWRKYSGNVKVWLVDGFLVRAFHYNDFTEGGHDLVYSFVPPNEVWIDSGVRLKERKFILLHELHERTLMLKGWSYRGAEGQKTPLKDAEKHERLDSAHQSASNIERFCRQNPDMLEKHLKQAFTNSEKAQTKKTNKAAAQPAQ